jgi:hypothetical protein
MKWPHKKFVQALLCERYGPDQVYEELEKWHLPFPVEDLQDMYQELKPKQAAYFNHRRKEISREFLQKEGLETMWAHYFNKHTDLDTTPIKGAFALLENIQVRTLLYAMALAGMAAEDMELIINGKFEINASSEDVDAFLHYFFNMSEFTYAEKSTLEESFAKDVNTKRAFKLALKGDRNYMLWKLDAAPDKSFDAMLRDMLADSYYLFKEKAKNEPDTATKFGALAVKLADRLERAIQSENKADDLFSEVKFSLNKDDQIVKAPTADDIGAEVGGKIEEYEVKSKLPDFKSVEQIGDVAPKKPRDIDYYDGQD